MKVTGGEKDTKVGKKVGQRHDSKESIKWTEMHQQILEKMIDYLQSPEVISYPSFDLPFFITCDASSKGLGAVLYQNQEGVDRVISYASRTLSEAEKNYHLHSGKLEFLGLKWAITERFSNYLRYGPPFVVYTDNNPLTYVMSSAKLNAVGQRWVNELADYQFTIKYRPGKENVDADFLSRKPTEIAELKEKCTMTIESHSWNVIKSGVEEASSEDGSPVLCMGMSADRLVLDPEVKVVPVAAEELGNKQRGDSIIGPIYRAVAEGSRPSRKE